MRRRAAVFAILLALLAGGASRAAPRAPSPGTPLRDALAAAGIRPEQVGYVPRGSWVRYPDPRHIPYVPRMFEDLFAHPDRIPSTLRLLGRAGEDMLSPGYRAVRDDGLFRASFYLGWDLRRSGFRDYDPGLNDEVPREGDPLAFAVERLWREADLSLDLWSLDKPADYPKRREEIAAAGGRLDPALRAILAQAILDLSEAVRWHRIAFRNADGKDILAAWELRALADTQFDGMEVHPCLDDLAAGVDEAALITSARKTVGAGGRLEAALRRWRAASPGDLRGQSLDLLTPAGRIVVRGTGDDLHEETGVLLAVDLGGDDTWRGSTGAPDSPLRGVSLAVDLAGNDRYAASDLRAPSQGSGILGTGVLVDVDGSDEYDAVGSSQGYGLLGTGLLADLAGDDRYRAVIAAQGAGEFGVGLLLDLGGNDEYRLVSGGQGFGGIGGGIGTLFDLAGDDFYYAEPDAAIGGRGDYHSEGKVNYSYAQGAGAGRRGDLSDGHSWAGGMGTLLDRAGNDRYVSGNWSAGSGYWYGMGFLHDLRGDDRYEASTFSIAAGAHFCIGALVDEAGDDRYTGTHDSHTGMCFAHDYTVALLLDAAGNDQYSYGAEGFAHAVNMSQAFFLEGGGDDSYSYGGRKSGFGSTNFQPEADLALTVNKAYQADGTQIGLFLDASGRDRYILSDPATATAEGPRGLRDGATRVTPADPGAESEGRHAGIFVDLRGSRSRPLEWLARDWAPLPPPPPAP